MPLDRSRVVLIPVLGSLIAVCFAFWFAPWFTPWLGLGAGGARLTVAAVAPGLAFLLLLRRPSDDRPDDDGWVFTLLLAAALTPALWAASTAIAVLLSGWPLDRALGVCALTTLAALVFAAATTRGRKAIISRPRGDILALLPVAAMVALALFAQLAPATRLSYHGLIHTDILSQLATRMLPPESPAMAGEPLHYYWLYHWLLLVYGRLLGASVLLTSPVVNTLSLAIYVAAGWQITRRFSTPARASLAALAVGFAGNLFFPVWFLGNIAWNGLPESGFYWPFQLLDLGAPAGDPRLATLLAKFYNMSGFPLGLALFAVLVAEMLPHEQRRPRYAVVFLALTGTLLLHSAAAVAAYAALSLAHFSVSIADFRRSSLVEIVRANLPMGATFLAPLALAGPYFLATSWGSSSEPSELISAFAYNGAGVLFGATALLPVLLYATSRAWGDTTARFLVVATAVPLLAGLLTFLPAGNQYKLVHLSAFPGGALLFWILRPGGSFRPRLRDGLFAGAVALAVLAHGITAAAYAFAVSAQVEKYAGDGDYLQRLDAPDIDRALRWLREHTPPDSVIVSKPIKIGASDIMAISGRGNFVLDAPDHWRGDGYVQRYRLAVALFSERGHASSFVGAMRKELDRPLYVLLLADQFPDDFSALAERFRGAPETLREVFRNQGAVVYEVKRL